MGFNYFPSPVQYATASGTDTYVVAGTTVGTVPGTNFIDYFEGLHLVIKFTNANTGAATININGKGARGLKKSVTTDLASGDIVAGGIYHIEYDGTNFQIGNAVSSGGGGGGGTPATTVTDETTYGITPAVGTDTEYARQDHTHGSPTAPTAASVGADPAGSAAAAQSTAESYADSLASNYDTAGAAAAAVVTANAYTDSGLATKKNDFSENTAFNKNFGSSAGTVTEGNDSRLSNSRTPNGTAGGDLSGSYPNPSVNQINSVTKSYYDPTSSIQTQLDAKVPLSSYPERITAYKALGSSWKGNTLGMGVNDLTLNNAGFTSQQIYIFPVTIPRAATIFGLSWYQAQAFVGTANNYNGVALFIYDGAGTLNQVAASTNDGNIWKTGAGVWASKSFATPYVAAASSDTVIYYAALLESHSAVTTALRIGRGANVAEAAMNAGDFTNSSILFGQLAGQTTMPASIAMSALTVNQFQIPVFLN